MNFPLDSFLDAATLETPIITEVARAYARGVDIYRHRKAWADSPVGGMVASPENATRTATLD